MILNVQYAEGLHLPECFHYFTNHTISLQKEK